MPDGFETVGVRLPQDFNRDSLAPVLSAVRQGAGDADELRFDCSQLETIDTAAFQLLLAAIRHCRSTGRRCRFEDVTEPLRRPAEILGLADLFLAP